MLGTRCLVSNGSQLGKGCYILRDSAGQKLARCRLCAQSSEKRSDGEELWIVAEASVTLGASDVRRAKRRAAALGTAMGVNCLAAVISDIVPETLDLTGVDLITYHDKAV